MISLRNVKVIFYAIFNVWEAWMNAQDPAERVKWNEIPYQRKIRKYRLMMDKLDIEPGEALYHCSKDQQ